MKKLLSVLFVSLMLGGLAAGAWAAETENKNKGDVALLFGNQNAGWINYQVTKDLKLFIQSDEDDFARGGVAYQLGQYFGVKAGMTYDNYSGPTVEGQSKTNPFGEINWVLPIGSNNTKFIGKYDYDYYGKDWQTYEAAIRVEMFPNQYVSAGVRGDSGDGAIEIDLDKDDDEVGAADNKEPIIFIRGDFSWQWKRLRLNLRPILYVQGTWLHDYDLSYKINDRTSILFNMNSLYDKEEKYRTGIQFKF